MTQTVEHERIVLAGIFPNRVDLLTVAFSKITAEYFTDTLTRTIFQLAEYYYQQVDGVLSARGLNDLLSKSAADPGRIALYEEAFQGLCDLKVDDTDFAWSLSQMQDDYATAKLRGILTKSIHILSKGDEVDGETVVGQEPAREFLTAHLSALDAEVSVADTPHGDMREEESLILEEYDKIRQARAENKLAGVRFGVSDLDEKVGGLQPGELVLSAGFSSDGKTALCVQLAWSAAIEQGKNVLFLSTETVSAVIRRRILSRHSRHSKFEDWGIPEGLNSRNLKEGTLSEEETEFMKFAVRDFTSNPDYGSLYIHQVPRGASMEVIEQIMNSVQRKFNIDLVICDYLALLRPSGIRNTDRESLSGILKNAKQISTTFNKGTGVPFVSPWQVNRASKENADSVGMYTSQSLAETAEATNTPDIIISILAPTDNTERYADITGQVLKNRDGETANGILLSVDYATSMFSSKRGFESISSLTGSAGGFGGLI